MTWLKKGKSLRNLGSETSNGADLSWKESNVIEFHHFERRKIYMLSLKRDGETEVRRSNRHDRHAFCLREEKGNAKGMMRGSMAKSITVLACY